MDNVELIMQLEELKQKLAHYETNVKPLADRELQRLREQAVKEYKLTEEEAKLMADKLAVIDTEEGIKATAIQLAGAFRASNKPQYVDPSTERRSGNKVYPRQQKPEDYGKQLFHKLADKGRVPTKSGKDYGMGAARSSVTIPPAPKSPQKANESIISRWRKRLTGRD